MYIRPELFFEFFRLLITKRIKQNLAFVKVGTYILKLWEKEYKMRLY